MKTLKRAEISYVANVIFFYLQTKDWYYDKMSEFQITQENLNRFTEYMKLVKF